MCREEIEVPGKSRMRSLESLTKDFQQRQLATEQSRPDTKACPPGLDASLQTGVLKKYFHSKGFGFITPDDDSGDVFLHASNLESGCAYDLVVGAKIQFDCETDARSGQRRAKSALVVQDNLQEQSWSPADETIQPAAAPEASHAYSRDHLLACRMLSAKVKSGDSYGLHTMYRREVESRRSCTEDPSLNDEALVAKMEARLNREDGADAFNNETFGDCSGGWSYEEAVEANEKLNQFPDPTKERLPGQATVSVSELYELFMAQSSQSTPSKAELLEVSDSAVSDLLVSDFFSKSKARPGDFQPISAGLRKDAPTFVMPEFPIADTTDCSMQPDAPVFEPWGINDMMESIYPPSGMWDDQSWKYEYNEGTGTTVQDLWWAFQQQEAPIASSKLPLEECASTDDGERGSFEDNTSWTSVDGELHDVEQVASAIW